MPAANRYHAEFFDTVEEIRQAIGDAATKKVLEIFIMRHGDQEMRIPNPHDLWREERDRQICAKFTGANLQELAILFTMSVTQIRRIIGGNRR